MQLTYRLFSAMSAECDLMRRGWWGHMQVRGRGVDDMGRPQATRSAHNLTGYLDRPIVVRRKAGLAEALSQASGRMSFMSSDLSLRGSIHA